MSNTFLASGATTTIQANSTITAATNAAPIAVTTSAVHGLVTGDVVQISGATGNLAANGKFVVTVVDTSHFTLNNSNGSGAWASGGTVAHIGHAYSLLFDNTIFPNGITRTSFKTNFLALSAGSNCRTEWQDSADINFVTAQTFWSFDKSGAIVKGLVEANFASINEDYPSLRGAAAGDWIRVIHYVTGGAGSVLTVNDSINY